MRHSGTRVLISTQSPLTIPPELFELVSVVALHRFHSSNWFSYLKMRLPLQEKNFDQILELPTGRALVFSPSWSTLLREVEREEGERERVGIKEVQIRERVTFDGGRSKV